MLRIALVIGGGILFIAAGIWALRTRAFNFLPDSFRP